MEKRPSDSYLCSCGGKCTGICKKEHLHGVRQKDKMVEFNLYPAAYKPRRTNGSR